VKIWPVWAALPLSVVAFLSYPLFFLRWPITRDVPWANFALFALVAALVAVGLRRAFAPGPRRALRAALGLIPAGLSAAIFASFLSLIYVEAYRLPASSRAPQVGQRAPEFTLLDVNSAPVALSELLAPPTRGVLVIFYMHEGCLSCNAELRGIQARLSDFTTRGVRPVAISADTPDVTKRLVQEAGYGFTFLSDATLETIRRYDVLHESETMPRPAAFLIDTAGTVRWRTVTDSMFVRPRPESILEAARRLP
jgi:mycoredoxin-dependent peroxiredoxin